MLRFQKLFTRRFVLSAAAAYFAIGLLFASFNFWPELKTYECKDSTAPNGYVTIFNNSFTPPSGMDCHRRAFTTQQLATFPTLTMLWLPLVAGKLLLR